MVYVAGVPVPVVTSKAGCRSLTLVEWTVPLIVLTPEKAGELDGFGGFKRGDAELCLKAKSQGCCQAEVHLLELSKP
jgi:hypothetical protein